MSCSSYNIQLLYSDVFDVILCLLQLYPPARVKYMLQIEAAQTVCENHASVNVTDCALQSNAEVRNAFNIRLEFRVGIFLCIVMHLIIFLDE